MRWATRVSQCHEGRTDRPERQGVPEWRFPNGQGLTSRWTADILYFRTDCPPWLFLLQFMQNTDLINIQMFTIFGDHACCGAENLAPLAVR